MPGTFFWKMTFHFPNALIKNSLFWFAMNPDLENCGENFEFI